MTLSILITGAGSGFGKAAALALAAKGHEVIAGVQIAPQRTDLLAVAAIAGVEMDIVVLDITTEEDRNSVFDREIDVLVNNAGRMETGSAAEIPMDHVRRNFETNVFGTLAMIQGFTPQMVKRGSGKIVTVSSVAGLITMPFASIYSGTKHALETIMEGLSIELQGTGVKVCTVNPAVYGTGFNDRGAETMMQWFDPEASVIRAETLAMIDGVLDGQLDPQEQVDDLVRVIEEDNPKFRNMCPKAVEPWIKSIQARGWEASSDEPVWVNPPQG